MDRPRRSPPPLPAPHLLDMDRPRRSPPPLPAARPVDLDRPRRSPPPLPSARLTTELPRRGPPPLPPAAQPAELDLLSEIHLVADLDLLAAIDLPLPAPPPLPTPLPLEPITINFPRPSPPPLPEAAAPDELALARRNLPSQPTAAAPKKPLVMIVDPDDAFGTLLQHFLERLGYSAFRLSDSRYALRLLRELPADLLITSLDGDEVDGMELLVGLSAEQNRPPVLLCTRHPSASPAVSAATDRLGVRMVLPRPCRFDLIASAVQRLLGPSAMARTLAEGVAS
jgi:CheY-like chemotaxis protein